MKTPQNIVKFRLDGFPLYALDQKRMRQLGIRSDRTGVPIPELIRDILGQMVDACIADAELPKKIVKFPAAATSGESKPLRTSSYAVQRSYAPSLRRSLVGPTAAAEAGEQPEAKRRTTR